MALRQRYQYANITLVVGEEPGCSNRKIAKLVKMADRAKKAEIFVLSDADVSVDRDYLKRIVGELMSDEKIGIATCAYRARPGGSFASRLEALYVNTDFVPQILLAEMIEPMITHSARRSQSSAACSRRREDSRGQGHAGGRRSPGQHHQHAGA